MPTDACPLPDSKGSERDVIARLLGAKRIAIVGLSDDHSRPSFQIAEYLIEHGKEIVPVNPNYEEVLGLKCYPSLADVPGEIDLVNVFRRPEFCAAVVKEAIASRANGVWLQAGIRNPEARRLAQEAGLDYVEDRCIMIEHMHQS